MVVFLVDIIIKTKTRQEYKKNIIVEKRFYKDLTVVTILSSTLRLIFNYLSMCFMEGSAQTFL